MKRIIVFISPFNDRTFDPNQAADAYETDGDSVYGRQTNEAPINYLLRCDSEIEEVFCICTADVLKPDAKWGLVPYEYLCQQLQQEHHSLAFSKIEIPNGYDFATDILTAVLKQVGSGDTVYLETTGGPREVASQLMLLTRILLHKGVSLGKAVYSKNMSGLRRIEDVTDLYRTFDLINGLSEFERSGVTDSLRNYYDAVPSDNRKQLKALLDAMQELADSMTLGRTAGLEQQVSNIQRELEQTRQTADAMLATLLELFAQKFNNLQTLPDILEWCLDNNLIQQALTIYNERMPGYFLRDAKLLTVPELTPENTAKSYQDENQRKLDQALSLMGQEVSLENIWWDYLKDNRELLYKVNSIKQLKDQPPEELTEGIANLILLRKYMYQGTALDCRMHIKCNHFRCRCFSHNWKQDIRREQNGSALIEVMQSIYVETPCDVIDRAASFSGSKLKKLLGCTNEKQDEKTAAIRHLKTAVERSDVTLHISVEQMQRLLTDYLYVRVLRNQMNHNNEENSAHPDRTCYLEQNGYQIKNISVQQLKNTLREALREVREAVGQASSADARTKQQGGI